MRSTNDSSSTQNTSHAPIVTTFGFFFDNPLVTENREPNLIVRVESNEVLTPAFQQLFINNFVYQLNNHLDVFDLDNLPTEFLEPVPREIIPYETQASPTSYQGILESRKYTGDIPNDLCCPISGNLMNDPIKVSSNQVYDRESLQEYFKRAEKDEDEVTLPCPLTRLDINKRELENKTDQSIKEKIEAFIETIPIPQNNKQANLISLNSPVIEEQPTPSLMKEDNNKKNQKNIKNFSGFFSPPRERSTDNANNELNSFPSRTV